MPHRLEALRELFQHTAAQIALWLGTVSSAWAAHLAAIDWGATAAAAVAGITTLVMGILGVLGAVDRFRMDSRRRWDEFNKESLSGQLALLKDDTEKLRRSNHDIRDHLQVSNLEAQALREDLHETTDRLAATLKQLTETSEQLLKARAELAAARAELAEANGRIAHLTDEVERLQAQINAATAPGGMLTPDPDAEPPRPRPGS